MKCVKTGDEIIRLSDEKYLNERIDRIIWDSLIPKIASKYNVIREVFHYDAYMNKITIRAGGQFMSVRSFINPSDLKITDMKKHKLAILDVCGYCATTFDSSTNIVSLICGAAEKHRKWIIDVNEYLVGINKIIRDLKDTLFLGDGNLITELEKLENYKIE